MDKFKEYYKAIAGFMAALGVFAGSILALGIQFPNGIVAVLTTLVAAGIVGGVVAGSPANKLTPDQIMKQAPALGLAVGTTVADATIDAVSSAVTGFINSQAKNIAQPSKGQVHEIAAQVPAVVAQVTESVVEQVLGQFADSLTKARR